MKKIENHCQDAKTKNQIFDLAFHLIVLISKLFPLLYEIDESNKVTAETRNIVVHRLLSHIDSGINSLAKTIGYQEKIKVSDPTLPIDKELLNFFEYLANKF